MKVSARVGIYYANDETIGVRKIRFFFLLRGLPLPCLCQKQNCHREQRASSAAVQPYSEAPRVFFFALLSCKWNESLYVFICPARWSCVNGIDFALPLVS